MGFRGGEPRASGSGPFGEWPGAGRAGLASGLLPRFWAGSPGHPLPALPPLGVPIGATRAGRAGRRALGAGKEAELDHKHLEVTSAVSSSLCGHGPLLANKSVEPKT